MGSSMEMSIRGSTWGDQDDLPGSSLTFHYLYTFLKSFLEALFTMSEGLKTIKEELSSQWPGQVCLGGLKINYSLWDSGQSPLIQLLFNMYIYALEYRSNARGD